MIGHIQEIEAVDNEGTCLVGPGHDEPAIKGHVVPKSHLELIAEQCGSHKRAVRNVSRWALGKLRARAADRLPAVQEEHDVQCVSIRNERMDVPAFACESHDREVFSAVDGPGLDLSNPQHCALVLISNTALLRA